MSCKFMRILLSRASGKKGYPLISQWVNFAVEMVPHQINLEMTIIASLCQTWLSKKNKINKCVKNSCKSQKYYKGKNEHV